MTGGQCYNDLLARENLGHDYKAVRRALDSLIETCKRVGVDPHLYLTDVITVDGHLGTAATG